MKKNGSGEIVR